MITFTDLVALLLAFFVLLFAMSRVEQTKWDRLVDSLTADLNALERVETTTPAIEFHPDEAATIPGADLDYLTPVLREQLAAQPVLAAATMWREADRLVLSLPSEVLFQGNDVALAPQARELGFALGGILQNFKNRIEVEAHIGPSAQAVERAQLWRLALVRAALVSGLLTRSGYAEPIAARAVARAAAAETGSGGVRSRSDRLDIVVHELARGPR